MRAAHAPHFDHPPLNVLLRLWSFVLAGRVLAGLVVAVLAPGGPRLRPGQARWAAAPLLFAGSTWAFNARHGFWNDVVNSKTAGSFAEHAAARLKPVLASMARTLFLTPQHSRPSTSGSSSCSSASRC